MPMTLQEVGIDSSRIDEMAQHVDTCENLDKAWVPLYKDDIAAIISDCLVAM